MRAVLTSRGFETWKTSENFASLTKRYLWWKTPGEAMETPLQVAAQVMNLGDWSDVCLLEKSLEREDLREVINHAEIGMFTPRSWHFWHYRLELAEVGQVPPMPKRKFGEVSS